MGVLTINGKDVEVDESFFKLSPQDQQKTVEEISSHMDAPVTAMGAAKSFASGAVQGAIDLAGTPGSIGQAIEKYTGVPRSSLTPIAPFLGLPSGDQLHKAYDDAGLPKHDPENTIERVTGTMGELAPAIASGPGGIVRKGLQTIGSGLAVEGAGNLAKNFGPEGSEDWARTGAAIATGGPGAVKKPAVIAPEAGSYAKVAKDAYKLLDDSKVGLNQHGLTKLDRYMTRTLKKHNFDPEYHAGTQGFLNLLRKKVNRGGALFGEFQNLQADAKSLYRSEKDVRMATPIGDALDEFWSRLKPHDLMVPHSTDPKFAGIAARKLGEAKRAYFMQKKSELLDNIEKSLANREAQYSVSGMENALKTEMRVLEKKLNGTSRASKLLRGTFTPAEQKRIGEMAKQFSFVNTISRVPKKYNWGSVIAGGTIAGLGGLGSYLSDGDPTLFLRAAGILSAGSLLKFRANRSARRQWNDFSGLAKGGYQPSRSAQQLMNPLLRGATQGPFDEEQ